MRRLSDYNTVAQKDLQQNDEPHMDGQAGDAVPCSRILANMQLRVV